MVQQIHLPPCQRCSFPLPWENIITPLTQAKSPVTSLLGFNLGCCPSLSHLGLYPLREPCSLFQSCFQSGPSTALVRRVMRVARTQSFNKEQPFLGVVSVSTMGGNHQCQHLEEPVTKPRDTLGEGVPLSSPPTFLYGTPHCLAPIPILYLHLHNTGEHQVWLICERSAV